MGPGFKYHIATIAAIFFALAVGLVVGGLFVSPHLANQQTKAIQSLQSTLMVDNTAKKQQIVRYQEFTGQMLPQLLHGRLSGVPVAVLLLGDYADSVESIRRALTLAGARVLSTTTVTRMFDQTDDQIGDTLKSLQVGDPRVPGDREHLAHVVATALAHGDAGDNGILKVLERGDLIRLDPEGDYVTSARVVVAAIGSRSAGTLRVINVDAPLLSAMRAVGLNVAACESQDAAVSDIVAYQSARLGVTTVDNIDTDIGKSSLVFALRGDRDDYGVKETAHRLLPPTIDPGP